MDRIYLDNAATTRVAPEVVEKMLPFLASGFGNASSIHSEGRAARSALENARRQTACAIGAGRREVYFTSGGTESNNWAIKGAAFSNGGKGGHIVTTAVEHHSVLRACAWLEKQGFAVTFLPVDAQGAVSAADVERAVTSRTVLISVMAANNEIGTLEPVREIGAFARKRGILFHCDAVQAAGIIPLDVQEMKVDLLSLSAHKFHGPKGAGALYLRDGAAVEALAHGGDQERGRRAGTENVAAIVGLGEAITRAAENMADSAQRTRKLRDRLIGGILGSVPDARLNGAPSLRLPGNVNITFRGVDAEALLLRLDLRGISVSAGPACSAGAPEISHVLTAIGLSQQEARASLRFSLSRDNTGEEIDRVLSILPGIVSSLRRPAGHP